MTAFLILLAITIMLLCALLTAKTPQAHMRWLHVWALWAVFLVVYSVVHGPAGQVVQ